MYESPIVAGLALFNTLMLIFMCLVIIPEIKSKFKAYKETTEQVVDMLRSYSQEPDDYPDVATATDNITHTIFTEMLQYIPKEDREDLRERFEKEK
jgi:hypothetical protein